MQAGLHRHLKTLDEEYLVVSERHHRKKLAFEIGLHIKRTQVKVDPVIRFG